MTHLISNPKEYCQGLSQIFSSHADPHRAAAMEKYMRNLFSFYGLPSPVRKALQADFVKTHGKPAVHQWKELVGLLWRAEQRELQYVATELSLSFMKKASAQDIFFLEELIISKSWWDTVDGLAAQHAGAYFIRYPQRIPEITERWMLSGNFWLQRSCLLFQLKYKEKTDFDLLSSFINRLKPDKEFFIQKAIGWSLREYAKTNAQTVKSFVDAAGLVGLARREALKHM